MATFLDIAKRLETLQASVNGSLVNFLESETEIVEKMQRERISKGKTTDGENIKYKGRRAGRLNPSGSYTIAYTAFKNRRGGQTKHVDLKVTGEWQDSIEAFVKDKTAIHIDSMEVSGRDDFINDRYKKIFGVDDKQKEVLTKRAEPVILKAIKKHLQR